MTYHWNPMPHVVDIRCPDDGGHATFVFAKAVTIRLCKDIEYFKKSDLFEYHFFKGRRPSNPHVALYYHGLHRRSLESVTGLPEGYCPSCWDHSDFWSSHYVKGTATNTTTLHRQKHELSWPRDAYYQTSIRGQILWAFDRSSLVALRDYIAADNRKAVRRERCMYFLMKVPGHFLKAKVRDETVKKLNRMIEGKAI